MACSQHAPLFTPITPSRQAVRPDQRKEAQGWTFAFLGANQDAWTVGESIGVGRVNSDTYDAARPEIAMRAAARATADYFDESSELPIYLRRRRGHFRGSKDAKEYLRTRDEEDTQ